MSKAHGLKDPGSLAGIFWVNGDAHAMQALSGVAGLFRINGPTKPDSERAAATASLMAKKTELPRKRVGSPIPLEE